ncbi:ESX-1 secretion-associated protein EspK-like isoform X2 [Sycon ciliatum]|uniref:ESX-1 secretion-associated protein EspK-like isoform X2 n=1 Tax=Sycon ciliatum TaxID=27933 RepID=UPI0031F6F00B
MDYNPFDLDTFVCDIQPWLNKVDADRLRRMVIQKRLITDSASIERLKRIRSLNGQCDHNEDLIQLLRAGGLKTYRVLGVVIEELGYEDKSKEMLSMLSPTVNPFRSIQFISEIQPLITTLAPERFRNLTQQYQLLTKQDALDNLAKVLSERGTQAHNTEILLLVEPGEHDAYHGISKIVREMGYPEKSEQMIQFLQNSQTSTDGAKGEGSEEPQSQDRAPSPMSPASPPTTPASPPPVSSAGPPSKAAESLTAAAAMKAPAPAPAQVTPVPTSSVPPRPAAMPPAAAPSPVQPANVWHGASSPPGVVSPTAVSPTSPALPVVAGYATPTVARAPPTSLTPLVSPTAMPQSRSPVVPAVHVSPTPMPQSTSPALPVVAGYALPTVPGFPGP